MAKVTVQIPEPKETYDVSNQRQIQEALTTFKNQLNTSYQQDLTIIAPVETLAH